MRNNENSSSMHERDTDADSISRRTFASAAIAGVGLSIAGCQTMGDTPAVETSEGHMTDAPASAHSVHPLPAKDEIDPNNFPRSVGISNNCRFSAFMVGSIPFTVFYREMEWKHALAYFKSKVDDAVREGYLKGGQKAVDVKAHFQAVIDALDALDDKAGYDKLTEEKLLTINYFKPDSELALVKNLRDASDNLMKDGVFEPHHHVPDDYRGPIKDLFMEKSPGGSGLGFFEIIGPVSFKEILCNSKDRSETEFNQVLKLAKEYGVLQFHQKNTMNGYNVHPDRFTGTAAVNDDEKAARDAFLMGLQDDAKKADYRYMSLPNNKCCDDFTDHCIPGSRFCQHNSSGLCSQYSDDCP